MDATMLTILTVIGTGLTAIGVGVGLFRTLWKALEAQARRFDAMERHIDQRFEAVYKQLEASNKQWTERFEMADKVNRERFEMAEKANRERFEMAERANRERLEAMDERWTERLDAMDRRWAERFEGTERRHAALNDRFDVLDGRFDDLYRHLLDAPPRTARPGAPAARQESAP